MKIITYPNDALLLESEPIGYINAYIRDFINIMKATMIKHNGIGLAAPQIGLLKRFFVYHNDGDIGVLIDPEIINHGPDQEYDTEGCLSIPGYTDQVLRFKTIQVRALNEIGDLVEFKASDLLSRIIQHEIDHLDGTLFVDRLNRKRRRMFNKWIIKNITQTNIGE